MSANHPLRKWREKNGLSGTEFGRLIGRSKFAVSDYESGRRWPGRDVAERIREATNGEVTPNDFLPAAAGDAQEAAE